MSEKNVKFDSGRANANNPNNITFWQERGFKDRPENWQKIYQSMDCITSSKNRMKKRSNDGSCFMGFDAYGPLPKDGFGRLGKDDY